MFFIRNLCLISCVIFSSLVLLHNCVPAFTHVYSNVNQIVSAAPAELAHVSLSKQSSNATSKIHIVDEYNLEYE